MSAYGTIDTAVAGMKDGDSRVVSRRCADVAGIPFGMPVFGYVGASGLGVSRDKNVHTYKNDRCVMTFDGDFSAGDVITITVNGVAGTPVTFAVDHNTTMAALVAQLEADFIGLNATGVARVLTLDIDGTEMTVTETVVGGGAATGTAVYSSRMVFVGFSIFTQKGEASRTTLSGTVITAGSAKYEYEEAVNVMVDGWIYVVTDSAVDARNPVYVVVLSGSADQGKCTDTVGSNMALTGASFEQTKTVAGVALVRINK